MYALTLKADKFCTLKVSIIQVFNNLYLQGDKGVRDGRPEGSPLSRTSAEYLLFITVLFISDEDSFEGANELKFVVVLVNTLSKSANSTAETELEALISGLILLDDAILDVSTESLMPKR